MSIDFVRPAGADVIKARDIEQDRALRLYCTSAGQGWALQVRSPAGLRNGQDGKDFIIATARLGVDDMHALRDAIDQLLAEY